MPQEMEDELLSDGEINNNNTRKGRKGKERETGKPARLARSRAACAACHKAKQSVSPSIEISGGVN